MQQRRKKSVSPYTPHRHSTQQLQKQRQILGQHGSKLLKYHIISYKQFTYLTCLLSAEKTKNPIIIHKISLTIIITNYINTTYNTNSNNNDSNISLNTTTQTTKYTTKQKFSAFTQMSAAPIAPPRKL